VQIGLLRGSVDGKDGIDDVRGELLGESTAQLCGEGGTGDRKQQLAVNGTLELEIVEELYVLH
jgi:hypothetical protein